jgi:Tfp pilus assembly protein PilZ
MWWIILIIASTAAVFYAMHWYYNKKLSPATRKALENEVKADVKDAAIEVKFIGENAAAKVKETVEKKLNNG